MVGLARVELATNGLGKCVQFRAIRGINSSAVFCTRLGAFEGYWGTNLGIKLGYKLW